MLYNFSLIIVVLPLRTQLFLVLLLPQILLFVDIYNECATVVH
jgi:hypothetical protein